MNVCNYICGCLESPLEDVDVNFYNFCAYDMKTFKREGRTQDRGTRLRVECLSLLILNSNPRVGCC